MLYYIRDDSGELVGIERNGNIYYYQKNYQGDITGIYDSTYNLIVKYSYDAYGNILSIKDNEGNEITDTNHIGRVNPYRYRSYYYDEETSLYYLKSRYYNPLWGRFINADCVLGGNSKHLGYNLFVYSNNNPITYIDDSGDFAITGSIVGAVIGSAVLLGYGATIAVKNFNKASSSIITNAVDALNNAVYNAKERAVAVASASIAKKKACKKKKEKKKKAVYTLVNSQNKVIYVGVTNDLQRRTKEHQNDPEKKDLTLVSSEIFYDYNAYRGLEEQLMIEYATYKSGRRGANKIHGVSRNNKKYEIYMNAAEQYMYAELNVEGREKW